MIKIQMEDTYDGQVGDEMSVTIGGINTVYIIRKIETWGIKSATEDNGYSILSIEQQ